MRGRLVPVLYWIALTMLLAGAIVLLISGDDDDSLEHLGQVIAGLAWPIAAVGALLDTIRHQRREDAAERREDAAERLKDAAERSTDAGRPPAAEGRRLRSEA